MIRHELVGTARAPGQGGELRCFHHDRDFTIYVDGTELMSTRVYGSEEALAELALARFGQEDARRVLVGGLGMGFTLARALALTGPEAVVDVAELVPEVVTWNRELFGHCADHPLRDRRTNLIVGDVGHVIADARGCYDVILLDVDNGPEGLLRASNDLLYDARGLATARRALRPDGVLAVWSAHDNHAFEQRLRQGGFHPVRHRVRARRTKGPWRTIWVATTGAVPTATRSVARR
ncbi:MAG: hypothetical protein U1E73_05795 [Planctomycetota bacterium]